jgi:hypothetical protein
VLLLGDHGQTVSGDHGGATSEEIDSFLFAYSTMPLIHLPPTAPSEGALRMVATRDFFTREYFKGEAPRRWTQKVPTEVPRVWQTDLVPTVSVALGMVVPFGNLGSLMVELLPASHTRHQDAYNVLAATRANCEQVLHFIETYQRATQGSLPPHLLRHLRRLYQDILSHIADDGTDRTLPLAPEVAWLLALRLRGLCVFAHVLAPVQASRQAGRQAGRQASKQGGMRECMRQGGSKPPHPLRRPASFASASLAPASAVHKSYCVRPPLAIASSTYLPSPQPTLLSYSFLNLPSVSSTYLP